MHIRIPEGKVPWDRIAKAVQGSLPPEVILGPARGEDAAIVKIDRELWAISTDPISFSASNAGRAAVLVNANDVAVRGAKPAFFLVVLLVAPGEASSRHVETLLTQIRITCQELGVALIGGHTEVTPGLEQSLVIGTMLGPVTRKPITTGGLREGDWVGMTKWAGLEGTSILLTELGERLQFISGYERFRSIEEIFAGEWLSVVPEAEIAARFAAVNALHDITEGGVGEALFEMASASGLDLDIDPKAIPVLPETKSICEHLQMNPLGLIGSGALLVGCANEGKDELAEAYEAQGVPFLWLGQAKARQSNTDNSMPRFERDELLKAYVIDGIQAFVFDMDGTLIDSAYDWSEIRRRLSVKQGSIIEHLNSLESPQREQQWALLQEIESEESRKAKPKDGVRELLALLKQHGILSALVTNNSDENTRFLLERFGLAFDLVMTRDSGLWKPSGAPLIEAAHRLRVLPEQCLAVGDSHYDILAAREAQYKHVCLLNQPTPDLRRQADITFPDVKALVNFLKLLL